MNVSPNIPVQKAALYTANKFKAFILRFNDSIILLYKNVCTQICVNFIVLNSMSTCSAHCYKDKTATSLFNQADGRLLKNMEAHVICRRQ